MPTRMKTAVDAKPISTRLGTFGPRSPCNSSVQPERTDAEDRQEDAGNPRQYQASYQDREKWKNRGNILETKAHPHVEYAGRPKGVRQDEPRHVHPTRPKEERSEEVDSNQRNQREVFCLHQPLAEGQADGDDGQEDRERGEMQAIEQTRRQGSLVCDRRSRSEKPGEALAEAGERHCAMRLSVPSAVHA